MIRVEAREKARGTRRPRGQTRSKTRGARGAKAGTKKGVCLFAIPSIPAAAALALTVSWQVWDLGAQ